MSEAYPHLIFDRFSSKLGARVANILKYLFPPPKHDAKRVITFANQVRRGGGGAQGCRPLLGCWAAEWQTAGLFCTWPCSPKA